LTAELRKPLWFFPNLLSLDAPLVSVAWLFIFSKTWRVDYIPWEAYTALGLAVWVIYVADRLLDASIHGAASGLLQARHRFHLRFHKQFKVAAALALLASMVLVLQAFPRSVFGYLLVGLVLLAGFFALSLFSTREDGEVPHSKNILAGCTFAFGTAMIAHSFIPGTSVGGLVWSRELLCFAALCALNIAAIDIWEHAARARDREVAAADELTLTVPLTALGAACLWFAYLDHDMSTRPFFYAVLTGAALLYILNRCRGRFRQESLRVLADAALLAPLLIFLAFPTT
jgi:hypothetical protein